MKRGAEPAPLTGIQAEAVVNELEVPWGIAFVSSSEFLVTERPGRLRLVRNGTLMPKPVLEFEVPDTAEGGLLGIAVHPRFAQNSWIYLYRTTALEDGSLVNRVERYKLSPTHTDAQLDRVIVDRIPAGSIHNGGRLRFGPDGYLYIGTGETGKRELAQNPDTLAGKLLRVTADGGIPPDNPIANSPIFASGVRNSQGFDWLSDKTLVESEHGPSGEMGRTGGDELNFVRAGDNLGWPKIWKCEKAEGMFSPSLVWETAHPPGGLVVFRGDSIPQWDGSIVLGTLRSRALYRIVLNPESGRTRVKSLETYLQGEPPAGVGRIREVLMGPDGFLYLTTSNCDGRGSCPASKDSVMRIRPTTQRPHRGAAARRFINKPETKRPHDRKANQ